MEFGTVDDRSSAIVVGHFLQGEGGADHVPGELFAALGVTGIGPDLIVDGEAGVLPVAHALGERRVEAGFLAEKSSTRRRRPCSRAACGIGGSTRKLPVG